jgi:hypothetical protein
MSAHPTPPPLNPAGAKNAKSRREQAWVVAIANLALPGFGTVMAGRKVGYLQLGLSVLGVICFTVFLTYAIPHLGELLQQLSNPTDDPDDALDFLAHWLPWMAVAFAGIILCVTAWFWALGTSVKGVRGTAKSERR